MTCRVTLDDDRVEVIDDGAGAAPPRRRAGTGLIGLRERAEAVGAPCDRGLDPHGFEPLRASSAPARAGGGP